MLLHPHRFLGLEARLLAEDRVLDADLADVMQDAGAAEGADLGLGGAERFRHDGRILLNALRVAVRVGIARLDRASQMPIPSVNSTPARKSVTRMMRNWLLSASRPAVEPIVPT